LNGPTILSRHLEPSNLGRGPRVHTSAGTNNPSRLSLLTGVHGKRLSILVRRQSGIHTETGIARRNGKQFGKRLEEGPSPHCSTTVIDD
jgi:hypothetical protein